VEEVDSPERTELGGCWVGREVIQVISNELAASDMQLSGEQSLELVYNVAIEDPEQPAPE